MCLCGCVYTMRLWEVFDCVSVYICERNMPMTQEGVVSNEMPKAFGRDNT